MTAPGRRGTPLATRRAATLGVLVALAGAPAGCGGTGPRPAQGPGAHGGAADVLASADSSLAAGSYERALAAYRRAALLAEADGDRAILGRAALGSGLAALLSGDARGAQRSLTRAVELDPASAPAHVGLGRYFTAVRRYRDAKAAFERAEALDPASPEPRYHLGLAFLQAGQAGEALRAFRAALERDPSHEPARKAMRPILEERYRAAGVPAEYADLGGRTSVTRGELGVMLSVELGLSPDRPQWRSDAPAIRLPRDIEGAWGMTWLRVSVERGLLPVYPDGSLHAADPVTRASLALLLASLERRLGGGRTGAAAPGEGSGPVEEPSGQLSFPDLGRRHYLSRAAARAVGLGLPTRDGGRFEPQASASGWEVLRALRTLARRVGATPVVSEEPDRGEVLR